VVSVFYVNSNLLESKVKQDLFKQSGYANEAPFLLNGPDPVREVNHWLKALVVLLDENNQRIVGKL
jgi:hypothetical protein